jgi:hypothetical protein
MGLGSELERIARLHKEGVLTTDEFLSAKEQLLADHSAESQSEGLTPTERQELDLLRHKEREELLRQQEREKADQLAHSEDMQIRREELEEMKKAESGAWGCTKVLLFLVFGVLAVGFLRGCLAGLAGR